MPVRPINVEGGLVSLVEEHVELGAGFGSYAVIREGRVSDHDRFGYWPVRYVLPPDWAGPHYFDGQWPVYARLPYDVVEHDGFTVPLWRPDPERLEWEARYPAGSDARRRRLRGEMGLR